MELISFHHNPIYHGIPINSTHPLFINGNHNLPPLPYLSWNSHYLQPLCHLSMEYALSYTLPFFINAIMITFHPSPIYQWNSHYLPPPIDYHGIVITFHPPYLLMEVITFCYRSLNLHVLDLDTAISSRQSLFKGFLGFTLLIKPQLGL